MKNKRLTPYNLFRILWYEMKRIAGGIKHTASIDITDSCNLRCANCYHFRDKDQFEEDVAVNVWEQRFQNIYSRGVRFVTLLGGEPALRQDVLMLANRIFPFIDVITNGTIRIPAEFKHRLFISLDGAPDTNDRMRGQNVFSKIIKNYSGDGRVVIFPTLNRSNYMELEEIVKIAKEKNFKAVTCGMYIPCSNAPDPLRLSLNDRRTITDEIRRVRALHPDILRIADRMLNWYEKGDHSGDYCYWREQVLHFDVSMGSKKCFGHVLNCSACGCLAGASQSPLRKLAHPIETIKSFY
jgi:MoaA/NifB/PqqE/SkfB family radical SAM enzyme